MEKMKHLNAVFNSRGTRTGGLSMLPFAGFLPGSGTCLGRFAHV